MAGMRRVLTDVGLFGSAVLGMPLRPYQLEVARAVLDSIAARRGLQFTVLTPRQAGKNQPCAGPLRPTPRHPAKCRRVRSLPRKTAPLVPARAAGCRRNRPAGDLGVTNARPRLQDVARAVA